MNKKEIEIGTNAVHEEHGIVKIQLFKRGWVSVLDSAGELHKVRPATLEPTEVNVGDDLDENDNVIEPDEEELDEESKDSGSKSMKATLERHRVNYIDTVSHSGNKSQNNGDRLAVALAGLSGKQVCELATSVLELEIDLVAKYLHLNEGQRRMNAGNRLRAAIKNEDNPVTLSLVVTATESFVEDNRKAAAERAIVKKQEESDKANAEAAEA